MSVKDQDDLQLLLRRAAAFADYEADDRWDIVRDLHRRTDRPTFDAVCALGRLDGIGERVLSLDILGQIGAPANRPFLDDTLPLVIGACDGIRPAVLVSAITALGHLADPRGRPAVCRHVAHPAAEVRFAVAVALPGIAGDPASSQAVEALIRLSADPDADTRDWATFGLGTQLDKDTEPIREALAARLDDEDGDTAGEAVLGLARRADPRALPALLSRLGDAPGNLIVEAAAELGGTGSTPCAGTAPAGGVAAGRAVPVRTRQRNQGMRSRRPEPTTMRTAKSCLQVSRLRCACAGHGSRVTGPPRARYEPTGTNCGHMWPLAPHKVQPGSQAHAVPLPVTAPAMGLSFCVGRLTFPPTFRHVTPAYYSYRKLLSFSESTKR